MHACAGQGAASSHLPCSSAAVVHGSCSAQQEESRLLQLPQEIFRQILDAACSELPHNLASLSSQNLHALYSSCRPACHAIRQLIKHLKVDLDAPLTPVKEGFRQLALYPALNRLALSVHASSTALSDFMAGTKGTADRLMDIHTISVDAHELNITGEDICNIVLALPSLRDVTFAGADLPLCVEPLQRLSGLTRLNFIANPPGPRQGNCARELSLLTALQRLDLSWDEPSQLLPHLAQLSKLSHLEINSYCTQGSPLLLPEFSLLQHLTHLTWNDHDMRELEQQTAEAICACTCLVELFLESFIIATTAAMQQLVALPKLKRLAVDQLPDPQPSEPYACSWDNLDVAYSVHMWQLLPFRSVRHVKVDEAFWILPGCGDAASVAAATADIAAVAMVLAHGHIEDLHLEWTELPLVSCSCVIGGLAPMHQVGSLNLTMWVIDRALLLQISEVLPQLASLALDFECSIEQGAWDAMHSLSCLKRLTVECDVVPADVVEFAVTTSRGLYMCVTAVAADEPVLESLRTFIQE